MNSIDYWDYELTVYTWRSCEWASWSTSPAVACWHITYATRTRWAVHADRRRNKQTDRQTDTHYCAGVAAQTARVIDIVQYEDVNGSDQQIGRAAVVRLDNCRLRLLPCSYPSVRPSVRPSVLCSSAEPAAAATDAAPRTETTNGLEREAAHKNAMTVLTAAGARLAAES